jgi:hypothetical protein
MLKTIFFTLFLIMSTLPISPGFSHGLSLEEAVDVALANNPDHCREAR